jgi:hypothetical protein
MEATLEIVCYLSNIRNINILIVLVVIFCELEINFLTEKELQEEVH